MELVGVGSHIPCGVAGIRLAIPPAGRGRGSELIGFVRWAGVNVVGAFGIGLRVVGRAGAADVVTGDDDPLVALVHEDIDEVAGVGHFGRKKAFGMIAQVALPSPCLPPDLLENLKFLAKYGFRQERGERMVVGEAHKVHACGAGRGFPCPGFLESVVPPSTIAELVHGAELADIVNERTRVADGKSTAVRDVGE